MLRCAYKPELLAATSAVDSFLSAGGAHGLTFGFGGCVTWQNEQMRKVSASSTVTAVHGFYNVSKAIFACGYQPSL
jgi:hypothetical protein